MSERPVVQVEKIEMEKGKNAEILKKYYQDFPSVNLSGTGRALGPIVAQLGYIPGYGGEPDVPGSLDDIAKAGESDIDTILLRKNVIGNLVPKRFDEFLEDRQDAALGSLWDYFIGPGLKIAGFYKAGVNSNEDDADNFIRELNKRYPINPDWEIEAALGRYGYHGPEIEGFKSTTKKSSSSGISVIPRVPTTPGSGASSFSFGVADSSNVNINFYNPEEDEELDKILLKYEKEEEKMAREKTRKNVINGLVGKTPKEVIAGLETAISYETRGKGMEDYNDTLSALGKDSETLEKVKTAFRYITEPKNQQTQ